MKLVCKLCRLFGAPIFIIDEKDESKKDEKNEKSDEIKAHVEIHRLQLKLINKTTITTDETFKKCFQIERRGDYSKLLKTRKKRKGEVTNKCAHKTFIV